MTKEFKHLGVSFEACLAPDGTPFLNRVTYNTPKGVKINGNGTIPHPLRVSAESGYEVWVMPKDAADTLLETLQMDARSSAFDESLRKEIELALAKVTQISTT